MPASRACGCSTRRVYTVSQLEYTADVAGEILEHAGELRGYRSVTAPEVLRHFTAELAPVR